MKGTAMTRPAIRPAEKRTLLEYQKSDRVAVMRLNRPQALNALDPPLLEALIAAVEAARRDQHIRCIVVTGNGRVRTGTLNLRGRAREDGIDPADCKVTFPRLHDWKAA